MAELRIITNGGHHPTLVIHFLRVEPGARAPWDRPICHAYPEVRFERVVRKPRRARRAPPASDIIRSGQRQGRSY